MTTDRARKGPDTASIPPRLNSRSAKAPLQATLFADGGSRGNPGHAALGAVIINAQGAVIKEIGRYLGIATNNVAEWSALIDGLSAALDLGVNSLAVRMDSELVVKQLRGEYRVKHPDLQPLYARARTLLRRFEFIEIAHVPRKQNKLADALVNHVLDSQAALLR
ncbi:MAG: hypothetical protein NVSMB31_12560 [Vulcanimicrobiaceae bacterium]